MTIQQTRSDVVVHLALPTKRTEITVRAELGLHSTRRLFCRTYSRRQKATDI